ncbi:hypothetical protein [Chromobacterium sp. IIBBL 290-4]|uniref:hypothetical protein n=1 Tax=Chromobacterium sp. IIBBL 290-4 TaxID=2953890 RepID=UPI0020B7975B|nr:hypothetical protein [Chromobacterium sp. IIBBL 290-4]UTH75183.1 hypothetical protein NKT35_03535 [Chromobacterium sp. IIBBL 290-4]
MAMRWGILGPGVIESTRRTRTLGLGVSTRLFNDLAVPGLGRVWFGKQLYLATLGVRVAEMAGDKVTKIAVANAIEALACWYALNESNLVDGRIQGRVKLANITESEFSFKKARQPSFYVTQPMRMSCVTALPALGLVEAKGGGRFNGFSCSLAGIQFVEAAGQKYRPFNSTVEGYLLQWALGKADRINTEALRNALTPLNPLPEEARKLLKERILQGAPGGSPEEHKRRNDAFQWVASRRKGATVVSWSERPAQISPEHWRDMHAGACFFAMRDAAYAVLDALEQLIGTREGNFALNSDLPEQVGKRLVELRSRAKAFLEFKHADAEANRFGHEVMDPSDESVLRRLVARDGRILRLVGDKVCPGPAFKGGEVMIGADEISESEEETSLTDQISWPDNISYSIRNLWWMSLDLEGRLEEYLHPNAEETENG